MHFLTVNRPTLLLNLSVCLLVAPTILEGRYRELWDSHLTQGPTLRPSLTLRLTSRPAFSAPPRTSSRFPWTSSSSSSLRVPQSIRALSRCQFHVPWHPRNHLRRSRSSWMKRHHTRKFPKDMGDRHSQTMTQHRTIYPDFVLRGDLCVSSSTSSIARIRGHHRLRRRLHPLTSSPEVPCLGC